jgi:hypothetical protein
MQYYSASDASIFIMNPSSGKSIHLDKANGIQISSSRKTTPIYALGHPEYAFLASGNIIIEGFLEINFIHQEYLARALTNVLDGKDIEVTSIPGGMTDEEWDNLEIKDAIDLSNRDNKKIGNYKYQHGDPSIVYIVDPVDIVLSFGLGKYGGSSGGRDIVVSGCVFSSESIGASIKNEGNIREGYSFIGKKIK